MSPISRSGRRDQDKSQANRIKHGVSLETAAHVFEDPNYVLAKDRIDEEGEQRWHAIGLTDDLPLLVVHVYRRSNNDEEIIRIIPARKARGVKADDILGKPLSREQRSELARLKNRPDSEIDYSDIPTLTDEQLAAFQPNRQLVAVRLDRDVLTWLRSFGHG